MISRLSPKGKLKLTHIEEPRHTVRISLRKAEEVLKYRPDIVLFEYPMRGRNPETEYNYYPPDKKPREKWENWKNSLLEKRILKIHPWLKGDLVILENIEKLWKEGKQVLIYRIDAPVELTRQQVEWAGKDKDVWPCWVTNFLREQYMLRNLRYVEKKRRHENQRALVFMSDWHWDNLKFLRRKPSKSEIWSHYFKQFPELEPENIGSRIKRKNRILFKYWRKLSRW